MTEVVVVTTFFPNAADPHRAVFVRHLVASLRERLPLTVIAPVPVAPLPGRWRAARAIPARTRTADGLEVRHPRYLSMPGLFPLAGLSYAWAIRPLLRELSRTRPGLIVHAHCAFPDGVGVALAARSLGLRCVITAHGTDLNVHALRTAIRVQVAWALSRAQAVIGVSAALVRRAQALLGRDGVVEAIPCAAADTRVFHPRERAEARRALGLPDDARRIVLFVGRLLPIKAPEVLARAWLRLRADGRAGAADRLVFVGDGPLAATIRDLAEQAGGTIELIGARPQAEVAQWLSAASALCLPSRNEGTPNVVVEALASGVPVVASRVGGVPDLVRDGVDGRLVAAGDDAALAEALADVCGREWDAETIRAGVAGMTWDALAERNADVLRAAAAA